MRKSWLPELNERDRDIYEAELAYEKWLGDDAAVALLAEEGYDPSLDDSGVRAEDRERILKGGDE